MSYDFFEVFYAWLFRDTIGDMPCDRCLKCGAKLDAALAQRKRTCPDRKRRIRVWQRQRWNRSNPDG